MPLTHTPLIVGHRGAATLEPENTRRSLLRGAADGAQALEFDVHLSADGHVVVHHDASLERTAVAGRTEGEIADLMLAQLREVELACGERIMTLPEALEATDLPLYIEVKAAAAAAPTVEALRAAAALERATIISFLPDAIATVLEMEPSLPTALISTLPDAEMERNLERLYGGRDLPAQHWASFGVYELRREHVAAQHAAGRKVNVWTVHTYDQVRRLVSWGVDSITADDPAWLRATLARLANDPA
ncbi:glycerophosphodiester phosphodiesterase [Dermabacteraceae bacterium P13264]